MRSISVDELAKTLKLLMSTLVGHNSEWSRTAECGGLVSGTPVRKLISSYKVFSSIVSGNDIKILRDFGRNDSIVVSKPKKGKGVVIVDKVKYVESMQKIISDRTKFQEITQPMHKYVIKIEDKINNFL